MGLIISRFRTEKTTYQCLETLEEKIKNIEAYTINTQHRQKRFVGNFLLISIGLYVIGFLVFYFAFFPPTWDKRLLHSIPLIICPILIFVLKRFVGWYFQRKVNQNSKQLTNLRKEKKQIIEKVMEKETYKVALEILNRFDDKTFIKPFSQSAHTTPVKSSQHMSNSLALTPKAGPRAAAYTPQTAVRSFSLQNQSVQRVNSNSAAVMRAPINQQQFPSTPVPLNSSQSQLQRYAVQNKRTPYPIINQNEKTVLEKMVDYLIGDGPNNRFAMICKECHGHNGMALQEEYEYAVFRCAFCNTLNPAKKLRPIAPRLLPLEGMGTTPMKIEDAKNSDSSSTSPSEKDSGSDTDDSTESKKDENRKKADEERRMADQTNHETTAEPSAPVMNGADEVDEEKEAESDAKPNDEKKND